MGPRLYYLDDIPTPYRLGVHRHIARDWPGAFRVAFCAASEPGRDWSFDFSGLDVEILPGRQYRPRRQVNPMSIKWNPGILKSLRAFAPDVVVVSGYLHPTVMLAALWCRWHRVPYAIACETSFRSSSRAGWRWYAKRLFVAPMVRAMSFGLPVGGEAGAYLRALGPTDVAMYNFPNTPDTSAIAAQAERVTRDGSQAGLRREFGIPPDSRIVLFVGRLIDAKRPLDLVTAFRNLPDRAKDATLVIVGDGPLMDEVKTASKGDDRIVCTGWVREPERLVGLMAISSMLVLPSQHETWGAVVNEAMAAGIPVVESDRVGAAAELIESGRNGLVYPVGDLAALARAMADLLADEPRRFGLGQAARVTALERGHGYAAANLIAGALAAANARKSSVTDTA